MNSNLTYVASQCLFHSLRSHHSLQRAALSPHVYIRIRTNKGTPASFSPFSVPQLFYILPVSVPISPTLWLHFDTSSTVSSFIFFKWANHPRLFLPAPVLPLSLSQRPDRARIGLEKLKFLLFASTGQTSSFYSASISTNTSAATATTPRSNSAATTATGFSTATTG
ncbi:hypothetical protein F5H01DRAFT_61241 [Linnemannia elongata]|nr:hypothetical protein F5H01DRAFT_61241 [Linnemannia elongata]